jgi:hypothetical protein
LLRLLLRADPSQRCAATLSNLRALEQHAFFASADISWPLVHAGSHRPGDARLDARLGFAELLEGGCDGADRISEEQQLLFQDF